MRKRQSPKACRAASAALNQLRGFAPPLSPAGRASLLSPPPWKVTGVGWVATWTEELTRLAVQQRTGQRSRLMLDVDGYRARRRAELSGLAHTTADKVLATGEPVRLAPMNPFERKVVHDAIGTVDGVRSESEGEEPQRRVVVSPA